MLSGGSCEIGIGGGSGGNTGGGGGGGGSSTAGRPSRFEASARASTAIASFNASSSGNRGAMYF